ncbi:MAG: hypothetical protein LBF97_03450 [Elusimicrobiota bacterium]|jgi:hypothetical protein|nr:hypothetical protein [Elusimicrobiota bacterium]
MFRYNFLSDLLDGSLVTPIRNENGNIVCLNDLGKEVIYTINDFDFSKKPEDRQAVSMDDIIEQMEHDAPNDEEDETPQEVNIIMASSSNNETPISKEELEKANALKRKILAKAGLYYGRLDNISIDMENEVIKDE